MAVPVQQRMLADRRKRQSASKLASNEFFEHQCVLGKHSRTIALDQCRHLIAEADQTAWFEPDHRKAACHEWREGFDAALGFTPRLLDLADRKKRAPAAQWPVVWPQQMHPAAGGVQDSERGLDGLRLEITAERIHEQHDLAAISRADWCRGLPEGRAPARQAALRAEACDPFRQPSQPWNSVAQVEEPRQARRDRRIARQITDEASAPRQDPAVGTRRQHLDLHARHVDTGLAFAPAGLARDAKLEGLGHLVGHEGVWTQLTGDGKPQRIGTPARDVALLARDPI